MAEIQPSFLFFEKNKNFNLKLFNVEIQLFLKQKKNCTQNFHLTKVAKANKIVKK